MNSQLIDATDSQLLAVFFRPELSDFPECGAHLPLVAPVHFSQLVRFGSPELVLSLAFQFANAQPVVLDPLLAVGDANLEDLVDSSHVVWPRRNPLPKPQLHVEFVEHARVDVLDFLGMTGRPLPEGSGKIGTNFGGAMQEERLSAIEALLDAVADQQKVENEFFVLLFFVHEAEQVFDSVRVNPQTGVTDAPPRLPHQIQQEQRLGVTHLEQSCDIFKNFEKGEPLKAVGSTRQVF